MVAGFINKNKSSAPVIATDRRRFKRHPLCVKVVLTGAQDGQAVNVQAVNLSDGGVFIAAPARQVPGQGEKLALRVYIPRTTANTYLLEEVASQARVVRHQMLADNSIVGLAIKFDEPLDLGLDA